jgi:hypothetical protein
VHGVSVRAVRAAIAIDCPRTRDIRIGRAWSARLPGTGAFHGALDQLDHMRNFDLVHRRGLKPPRRLFIGGAGNGPVAHGRRNNGRPVARTSPDCTWKLARNSEKCDGGSPEPGRSALAARNPRGFPGVASDRGEAARVYVDDLVHLARWRRWARSLGSKMRGLRDIDASQCASRRMRTARPGWTFQQASLGPRSREVPSHLISLSCEISPANVSSVPSKDAM